MIRKKDGSISPLKLTLTIVLSLVILVGVFFGGFYVDRLIINGGLGTYNWAKGIIESHYLYDYPADYSEQALRSLADGLDQYSEYYTAEEYAAVRAESAGHRSGIGITYSQAEGGGIIASRIIGNSPAWKAGIRSGDVVRSGIYGGQSTNFAEDSTTTFADFVEKIPTGEEFTLTLDGDRQVTLAKANYTAAYTYMYTNSTSYQFEGDSQLELIEKSDEKLDILPDGYAYINLSQFYGTAASEMKYLVNTCNEDNISTLILDLRNNGGGYLNVMNDIAGIFIDNRSERKISTKIQYKNAYSTETCTPSDTVLDSDIRLCVLANSGTASASEALMGAMISYGVLEYGDIYLSDYAEEYMDFLESLGGEVKTKQTYGKGIMQSTYTYVTGEALKLTVAQLYWPNDKTIHGVGITQADGCKLVPADWIMTAGDSELKAAVAAIAS